MTSYIPHQIVVINHSIDEKVDMELACLEFENANRLGLVNESFNLSDIDFASITEDEVFLGILHHVMEWSNRMGLKGKRVYCLKWICPKSDSFNPFDTRSSLYCAYECTEEQVKEYYDNMDQRIRNYFGAD